MEKKKVSLQFENLCSKKVTIKNINYKEKQFCSFWTEYLNHDYVKSLSEGLQKVKVRKFVPNFINQNKVDLHFPFTQDLFPLYAVCGSYGNFFSGEIKIRYHIENHRDFKVDLYLKNSWSGSFTEPLIHYSILNFKFYIHLLLERISYISEKKITFSLEIDFNLTGEYWNERKNTEMEKESYFVAIYS